MTAAHVWDEVAGGPGDAIADDLRAMVAEHEAAADRSQQRHLGPSQIGSPCTRCLARHILGCPVTRPYDDPWLRIIGTAVHAWLDEAAASWVVRHDHARYYPEMRVQPDADLLPSGGRCDLYDADRRTVIDHKVVGQATLRRVRAGGPGHAYRRQAHLYGLGYANAGHHVKSVAIAYWQRGGRLSDLHVWTEPYDRQIADDALDRYRTIRDLCGTAGAAILPSLPADPDCWDCGGDVADTAAQPDPIHSDQVQPNRKEAS